MKRTLPILITLLACLITPAAQAKRVPNLELKDQAGNAHSLSELRGSIAVVNFWATWCGPCREEMPMLSKLSEEYAVQKVRFIAASADVPKDKSKIAKFVEAQKPSMDIWIGADLDMLERAGLGNVLPATLIVDQQGEVIARILGEAREADVRTVLDWLLAGKSGPPPPALVKHY